MQLIGTCVTGILGEFSTPASATQRGWQRYWGPHRAALSREELLTETQRRSHHSRDVVTSRLYFPSVIYRRNRRNIRTQIELIPPVRPPPSLERGQKGIGIPGPKRLTTVSAHRRGAATFIRASATICTPNLIPTTPHLSNCLQA